MKRSVQQSQAARRDLYEIAVRIGQDNPAAAERFIRAARETFERLAMMPSIGREWPEPDPELHELRWWRVAGFENYLVFYRASPESILVIRILHGARDIVAALDEELLE